MKTADTQVTEEAVLARMRAGNDDAWSIFLEHFSGDIFRVVKLFADSYDERMDLFVFVCGRLREDRMRRLRKFRFRDDAPCKFTTYLAVLTKNLALDHVRSSRGRIRPFRNIMNLDSTDRAIFELHIRDRQPLETTREYLRRSHGVDLDPAEIHDRAVRLEQALTPDQRWRLLSRYWARRGPLSVDTVTGVASDSSKAYPLSNGRNNPESPVLERDTREALRIVAASVDSTKRLAFTLRYKDGLRVRDAARTMSVSEKQIEHWTAEVKKQIRDSLTKIGASPADLQNFDFASCWPW
jgi:RNA polymerase sigma factor (sigma-70 family)